MIAEASEASINIVILWMRNRGEWWGNLGYCNLRKRKTQCEWILVWLACTSNTETHFYCRDIDTFLASNRSQSHFASIHAAQINWNDDSNFNKRNNSQQKIFHASLSMFIFIAQSSWEHCHLSMINSLLFLLIARRVFFLDLFQFISLQMCLATKSCELLEEILILSTLSCGTQPQWNLITIILVQV